MSDNTQLINEIKASVGDITKAQATISTEIKNISDKAAAGEKISKEALEAVTKVVGEITGYANRIVDVEQKLATRVTQGSLAPKTLGQIIIATDEFKNYLAGNIEKCRFDIDAIQANTITGQEGSPPRNSDTLVAADRQAGIVRGAFRALRVQDIIPQNVTTGNAVEYVRELAFTNSAAETAEADAKPQSSLTFALETAPVRTIAHYLRLSKQIREDAPALAGYIDLRLRYGVDLRKENQIIGGTGTGQNLKGITANGNYTAFSPTAGETELDSLNRMKYKVVAADYVPTGIIINPTTWGGIERIKGDDDHYVIGNPLNPYGPNLWGLPVVVSNAVTAGKAIVAGFDMAMMVWNRQGTIVEIFEQDADNVTKNLLTVRAEARLAFAVEVPAAVQYGALTSPGASA